MPAEWATPPGAGQLPAGPASDFAFGTYSLDPLTGRPNGRYNTPWTYGAAVGLLGADAVRIAALGNITDLDTTTAPMDVWSGANLGVIGGWDHRDIPFPPASGLTLAVVSDVAADAAAGTGARTVLIGYLDATLVAKTFVATLNGTANVFLPEPVRFVNRMIVLSSGTFRAANAGNVKVFDPATGIVYSYMPAPAAPGRPRGLARSAAFMAPANTSFDLLTVVLAINTTDTTARRVNFSINTMQPSGVGVEGLEVGLDSSGGPYRHEAPDLPILSLGAGAAVWLTALSTSGNNTNVTAAFLGIQRAGLPLG